MGSSLLFCWLCVLLSRARGCVDAPSWLFSLPDDLSTIYQGLTEPFVIIESGEVTPLLADSNLASIIALGTTVSEFPLVWCNAGKESVNYSVTLESSNTNNLRHPLVSAPNEGVLPTTPYRFRACFPCVSESHTMTIVSVTWRIIRQSDGQEFCPASFFFSKNCDSKSKRFDVCSSENGTLDIEDGFVNVTGLLKREQNITTSPGPAPHGSKVPVATILTSTFLPAAFILVILAVFALWLGWYRRRNKKIASFQPEAVSLAYQGVYPTWSQREPHEKEFPSEKLNLTRELGEGAFGVVYEAKAVGIEEEGTVSIVAVKQLRGESSPQIIEDFFREVDFMSRLDHPRVVRLLGVCSQQEPFAMIFEYMDLGDLRSFLRDAAGLGENEEEGGEPGRVLDNPLLSTQELLSIAVQVAEGMVYISSKHLIHRDLASRNCLVATGLVVKIADFGMSRDIYSSDYYRVHGSAMLPVRWMPPESLLYGKFSTHTDVWAFGVLLWEIFSFGQQPYTGLPNEEVIKCIERGVHPEIPPNCPATNLMRNCWKRSPKSRPSFGAISASLKTLTSTSQ